MDYKKITLKNGLRLVFIPQERCLATSVLVLVAAGSEYETKKINGLSHFLEHMMFKGTVNRPRVGQIAEELDGLGARFNAFTSQEYTGYWAKAESHKLPKIFEIISDLYLNPIFNEAEIEKERGVIIEEIHMRRDDNPMAEAPYLFMELLYGDQPAGWDVAGTKETMNKISKENMAQYRLRHYVAPKTVVVVAGKFNEKNIRTRAEAYFGRLRRSPAIRKFKTKELLQKRPAVLVKFKDSGQSHLVLGVRAFNIFDKRRYAIRVLADILGGGMSSRLFKKIREEMGAAYYVGAEADLYLDHGYLAVFAGTEHGKSGKVVSAILEEMKRLRNELVPEEELRRAKDHLIGNLIIGLETSDERASFYGEQEILTGKMLPPDKLIAKIQGIRAGDIMNLAKSLFSEKKLNLALIGSHKHKEAFVRVLKL